MEYIDFRLRISADGADRYRVEAQSPAGDAADEFIPPYAPQELSKSFWEDLESRDHIDFKELGWRLFQALMPSKVRSCFDGCLGAAQEHRGVRIKLLLDPMDSRVAWLGLVPWEVLYRADRQEFLGLSRHTPISRYLDTPHPVPAALLRPTLHVLAAMAQPRFGDELELDQELLQLRRSWSEDTGAKIEALEHATIDSLRERLCEQWDILHFMGHGGFDEARREGFLVLEDEDKRPRKISDDRFAIMLRGAERIRLVVLNACDTARTAASRDHGNAAGAAPMLVRAGIPAVTAMLSPVFDDAALLFNRALHNRLAKGDPVDVAVTEGRRAIHDGMPGVDWLKPVLFMRVPDGRLFGPATDNSSEAAPPAQNEFTATVDVIKARTGTFGAVVNEGSAQPAAVGGKTNLHAGTIEGDSITFGAVVNKPGRAS